MKPYAGDILEHALNAGLAAAAARFQVPIEHVRTIVVQFASEVEPVEAEITTHEAELERARQGTDTFWIDPPFGKRIFPDGLPDDLITR